MSKIEYRYHRVSPMFWIDPKVAKWDDRTRLLALYLLTCEHRITEGLFRLPKAYICADLGWTPEQLEEPFAILLRDGFIEYDETVSVMLLTNALKWNPTDNDNHAKGAVKAIAGLPETPLLWDFIRVAERYDTRLYKALIQRYGEPYGKPQTLTQTQTLTQHTHRVNLSIHERRQKHPPPEHTHNDSPSVCLRSGFEDGMVQVSRHYEQNIGMIGPTQFRKLQFWHDEQRMEAGVLCAAIDEAVRAKAAENGSKPRFSFLEGIIRNWFNDGIRTLADLKTREPPKTEEDFVAAILAKAAQAEEVFK